MTKEVEILLLDDNNDCLHTVQDFFQCIDAQVLLLSDEEKVVEEIKKTVPKLTLISLKLAHAKEWRLLKQLNEIRMPIIGLVNHGDSDMMQEGLRLGISAYLVKPLDALQMSTYFPVILTQVWHSRNAGTHGKERRGCIDRRILSRGRGRRWYDQLEQNGGFDCDNNLLHFSPFVVDQLRKCITRSGNKIELSPKEYNLFCLLLTSKDRVVTIEEIISHIWPDNNRASEENVKQYIYLLRKKIEMNPAHPCFIRTLKGFGYMFSSPETKKDALKLFLPVK